GGVPPRALTGDPELGPRLVRGRQDDAEDRSAAGRADDRDVAAREPRELARDRQPEARTAVGLRAVSRLEQMSPRFGAEARAVVADLDQEDRKSTRLNS